MTHAETQPITADKRISQWNATDSDYPRDRILTQILIEKLASRDAKPALVCEKTSLSYADIESRSNQIAHYLITQGVKPGDIIGLCVERSCDMLLSQLAIWKTGAAYVPLDPAHPQQRLAYAIETAKIELLITTSDLKQTAPAGLSTYILLDQTQQIIAEQSTAILDLDIDPNSVAYIIFTSGSTGKPKGVAVQHRAVMNFLYSMQREPGLTAEDRLLAVTTLSFDIAVLELFLPLLAGATVVIAAPGDSADGQRLEKQLVKHDITVMQATPSVWRLLINAGWHGKQNLKALCGGEAFPQDLAAKLSTKVGQIWNMYGPTETTVWSTCFQIVDAQAKIAIGKPIANTSCYVLDENMQQIDVGEEGELFIGGEGVTLGYFEREDLTNERFLSDPFSNTVNARMYRTGDLVRWNTTGDLEYINRIDNQVKLRGYRIELGEIEFTLLSCKNIEQAAAVVYENTNENTQALLAYLVLKEPETGLVSRLRSELENTLPSYMVPEQFIEIDQLPLNTSGKLDRNALLERAKTSAAQTTRARPNINQAYIAAQNPLQQYLTALWCEVLSIEKIGINDRFFELGGTSLQAAQIINTIQEQLQETIFIVTIYEQPTISQYAKFLAADYTQAVTAKLNIDIVAAEQSDTASTEITAQSIDAFNACVPQHLTNYNNDTGTKLERAIFILSPPRSGTSLLQLMFSTHPALYSGNECQLLHFDSMAARKTAYADKFSLWLEGLVRVVMDIRHCDVDSAKQFIQTFEEKGQSTFAMYQQLQRDLDGRILIDKSPSYALDPAALRKAEQDFTDPLYVHLVREPQSMMASFCELHMEQVLYLNQHSYSNRALAELVWSASHTNILQFLKQVPKERQIRIHYDALVTAPEKTMQQVCHQFNLPYDANMAAPYKNIDKQAVGGLYSESKAMLDPTLLEQTNINPELLHRRKASANNISIGDITSKLSLELGCSTSDSANDADKLAARRKQRSNRRGRARNR